ncbi:hypothetical protein [Nonomuraea endophytica]|uniref:hypothetical protein n=1 Tax=Nonomuraea endophytica TaxID=714136 RepID=UPI0037CC47B1
MSRVATYRVGPLLARRTPFITHGSLSAVPYARSETGRLPIDWAECYREDSPRIVLTVLSYATPIAWVRDDGFAVVPNVFYSFTSLRHQRLCHEWLNTEE